MHQNALTMMVNPQLIDPTLYASSLITLTKHGYTKHYYEGTNRVCSKIGGGFDHVDWNSIDYQLGPLEGENYDYLADLQFEGVRSTFNECIGFEPEIVEDNDLRRILEDHERNRNDFEPTFYYQSDHLGSAAYLTNDNGDVSQTLNYLPYGEDWVDIQNYSDTQYPRLGIYTYNAKEKDYESGFHYYGARYYWSEMLTGWLSVDPQTDDYPYITAYNYCEHNPVILQDPDGECPWVVGAIIGAAIDYGCQVYDNYHRGKSGSDAWTDVNWTSVAASAVCPGSKMKTVAKVAITVGTAAVSNTFEVRCNKTNGVYVNVNTDAADVAKKTAVDVAGSTAGSKLYKSGSADAVKQANKSAQNATYRANRAQAKQTNAPSPKNEQRVTTAQAEQQSARNTQVRTQMAHATVGQSEHVTTSATTNVARRAAGTN